MRELSSLNRIVFVLLILSGRAFAQSNELIIPAPLSCKNYNGHFVFNTNTVILVDRTVKDEYHFLDVFLKQHLPFGNKVVFNGGKALVGRKGLIITGQGTEKLPEGGYRLNISANQIVLCGKGAGLFYGIQSFMQLFPLSAKNTIYLPCMEIKDEPRFAYRGMMLDVSRHFFSVTEVKKVIDLMARYKLNNFHWHLTDNQGWRIEIKRYPKLTQVGAYRMLTQFHDNRDWFDQISYGGFYTQNEIREVVKYAAQRYVNIIPEIEMPGHALAALTAYPELKCEMPVNTQNKTIIDVVFCPREETFHFLEGVLTEVADLFPGKYIHIGGDEVNKEPWKSSAFCQDLIRKLNLKDEEGLQSYFIRRVEKILNARGKQMIGWDEILEGGIAPNAVVMSWRGEQGGITAAREKHQVIMSPETNGMYFDVYQSKSETEPINRWGYAPLVHTYNYNPLLKALSAQEHQYIMGVQANVWTEWIATPAKLEYMILPRMLALAEVAWSPIKEKNFDRFYDKTLGRHLSRLEAEGFNYRVPETLGVSDTTMIGSEFTFKLSTPISGAKIFYTLNGRVPDDTDLQYTDPLRFFIPEQEKRELRTLVITPGGRRSIASRTLMYNRRNLPATLVSSPAKGLKYTLFSGNFNQLEQLQCADVKERGLAEDFDISEFRKKNATFGLSYDGFLRIDSAGVYRFSLASVEGSQLFIDGEMVTDNAHPHVRFAKTGAIPLSKGYHQIRLVYMDSGKPKYLFKVTVSGPGQSLKSLDIRSLIFHQASTDTAGCILPGVYDHRPGDLTNTEMRNAASASVKAITLPGTQRSWVRYRKELRARLIKKTGMVFNHQLPLNMKQTGVVKMEGYEIRNISFQTRPGVFATANLFVPNGKGPFPAVITMSGHSVNGRLYDKYQAVGQTLAMNGYVSLNIDPWGAGERTTQHGIFEYHGANLGASLMDVGETLMGMQLSDNIRGVDLLTAMPFVDPQKIGATGASGGGNQTMWLAALDERIKAAVPVVSVGTFESYVMRNNCVCELLVDGLSFTEEAGILAMVAPRAIRMCNGLKDSNPSFYPSEMIRSFNKAKPVFEMLGSGNQIDYKVFDLPHGYEAQDRKAMLGWFNFHLKGIGDGSLVEEKPLQAITEDSLWVFRKGQRDDNVMSTVDFCKYRGTELKKEIAATWINREAKRKELRKILRMVEKRTLMTTTHYPTLKGWDRYVLKLTSGRTLPLLYRPPVDGRMDYTIVCGSDGKGSISKTLISELKKKGTGIILVDLWGTGENASDMATAFDSKLIPFHTLSRASLWLGNTVMGIWVEELAAAVQFARTNGKAQQICIDGAKEAGLAALFLSVLEKDVDEVILRDAPVSYHLNGAATNFYGMGIHVPGILNWGDITLAKALSYAQTKFITPRLISGAAVSEIEMKVFATEVEHFKRLHK